MVQKGSLEISIVTFTNEKENRIKTVILPSKAEKNFRMGRIKYKPD